MTTGIKSYLLLYLLYMEHIRYLVNIWGRRQGGNGEINIKDIDTRSKQVNQRMEEAFYGRLEIIASISLPGYIHTLEVDPSQKKYTFSTSESGLAIQLWPIRQWQTLCKQRLRKCEDWAPFWRKGPNHPNPSKWDHHKLGRTKWSTSSAKIQEWV